MSKRVVAIYEDDIELQTICLCVTYLSKLGFNAQWRVLNYLIVRFLGIAWALPKPQQ